MSDDVDVYRPPLVAKADLCKGDASLIKNLREGVPADVVVSQITAPDSIPETPETDVIWFDVQPNGIRRIGANSGPNYTVESLLATAEMVADATNMVDATWNGATDDVVEIATSGSSLGTKADQFPQRPDSDQPLFEDATVDMMQMGQAEAMHRSRAQSDYKYVFQLNSPDSDTAFEYRELNGDAGRISWDTYSAHFAGSFAASRHERSLISLHEQLGLAEMDADLDETVLAYIDTDAMDYEIVR